MSDKKITDKLPFLFGKVFTNSSPNSKKYRTTGNTYLCIIPIKINDGNSSIRINEMKPHFFKLGEPVYLGPTDTYYFCGPATVSMVFCSPTNSVGEEEVID